MNFFKQKNKKNNNKGFTIVETLVALFVFSIAVISMMMSLSRGIQGTAYSREKIIASYLAQEGIEYIRNLRDDYVYKDANWVGFKKILIDSGCEDSTGCYFNDNNISFSSSTSSQMIDNLMFVPCSSFGGICAPIRFNEINGRYGYSSGLDSGFTRKINIKFPNGYHSSDAVMVTSTVFFNKQGNNKSEVSFSENLLNLSQTSS